MGKVSVDVPTELEPTIRAVVDHFEAFRTAALAGSEEADFGAAEGELDHRVAKLESAALMGMLMRWTRSAHGSRWAA